MINPATMTTPAAMTTAAAAPATGASFSATCSAMMQKIAAFAAKIWAAIKAAAVSVYNAAAPFVTKAIVWCQANPAAVAIGVGAVAAAAAAYYCFCRKTEAAPAPAAPAAPTNPANPAPAGGGVPARV